MLITKQTICKWIMSITLVSIIDILAEKIVPKDIMEEYEVVIKGTIILIEFIIISFIFTEL